MGITIHFSGKIDNKELITQLKDELVDIAKIMKWKYDVLDHNYLESQTKQISKYRKVEKPIDSSFLDGICIIVHPKAEPFFICIDSEGNLTDPVRLQLINEGALSKDRSGTFLKTQFAPPDIHICVINLLRYLKKKYISNLEVFDEGGYWESGDKKLLLYRLYRINKAMDLLEEALSDIERDKVKDLPSDKLADLIEERLKKGFNNN